MPALRVSKGDTYSDRRNYITSRRRLAWRGRVAILAFKAKPLALSPRSRTPLASSIGDYADCVLPDDRALLLYRW